MQIFGLDPVIATIIFTIIGLSIQNILGWLKSETGFNVRNAVASAIIAFFTSVVAVGSVIGALPDNTDPLPMMLTIITVIGTVAGLDSLIKNGAKAAIKAK